MQITVKKSVQLNLIVPSIIVTIYKFTIHVKINSLIKKPTRVVLRVVCVLGEGGGVGILQ